MTLEIEHNLRNLADELGVTLPDLSDDEIVEVAYGVLQKSGSTASATFLGLNEVVNRVIDRRPAPTDFEIMEHAAQVFDLEARRRKHAHPACIAAFNEGHHSLVHYRCLAILCDGDGCGHDACAYAAAHMDDDDDQRRVEP